MKTIFTLLVLCIFLFAAPILSASAFSANELKSLLGATKGRLVANKMHIQVVGLYCLNVDEEKIALSRPNQYKPGFPYLWWKGGKTHPHYKIPKLMRQQTRLAQKKTKHHLDVQTHGSALKSAQDDLAAATTQDDIRAAKSAIRAAKRKRNRSRRARRQARRKHAKVTNRLKRAQSGERKNKFMSTDYVPTDKAMASLNKWKKEKNPLLRVHDNRPKNRFGFQVRNRDEISKESEIVDRHIPKDNKITDTDLKVSKITSCKRRRAQYDDEQLDKDRPKGPLEFPLPRIRYIRVWMSQNHHGQKWTYIMDFFQKLKGKTKIWVTKGRIPGSYPHIMIGQGLPRRLPRGCQLPQPPKPPTKCQESYQLGAQLSETIGEIVIKDEEKHADMQRLTIQQKYNGTGKGPNTGNLGEDIVMRKPGTKKNEKGRIMYNPKVPVPEEGSNMNPETGIIVSTNYLVDFACNGSLKHRTASLRTDDNFGTTNLWETVKKDCDLEGATGDVGDDGFNPKCQKWIQARSLVFGTFKIFHVKVGKNVSVPKVQECQTPRIQVGWVDIVKRGYSGKHQSEECKAIYPRNKDRNCGPFLKTHRGGKRMGYCNYGSKAKHCNV